MRIRFFSLLACTFLQVGGEVARRAKGLGMKVVAYDPYASEERAVALGVKLVTFDEALATADFFSLHMPLTPGTKNLFGDEAFSKVTRRTFCLQGRMFAVLSCC